MRRAVQLVLLTQLAAPSLGLHGEEFYALLGSTPHEQIRVAGAGQHSVPPPSLSLSLSTHGYDIVVKLVKHDALFAEGYEHITLNQDGTVLSREPMGDHCIYKGQIFDAKDAATPLGDAIVSVCEGAVEGRLRVGVEHDLVIAPHPLLGDGSHVVMHHSDYGTTLGAEEWSCGVEDHSHPHHEHVEHPLPQHHHRDVIAEEKRRRLLNGNLIKWVELVIVNDFARCDAFTSTGKTLGDMTTRSAGIVAVVDGMYAGGFSSSPNFDYNVKLQLIAQVSFAHGDPYTATTVGGEKDVDSLLEKYGEWRVTAKGTGAIPDHDNAQLFSGEDFSGSTVGYAPVSAMCMTSRTHGINMARITSTDAQTAGTVAHEMGHNFGMSHTNTISTGKGVPASCYDPNNPHIMDPSSSSTPPTTWTTCSKAFLKYYIDEGSYGRFSNVPACMENSPTTAWSGAAAVCGDGVREQGEQCDCGARPCSEVDPCCDAATCQLVAGAACSLLDACCQQGSGGSATQCTLRSTSHTCRAAAGSCDVLEKCDGASAVCPADQVMMTGTACSGPLSGFAGSCHGGSCLSHTEQCKHTQNWFAAISGECGFRGDADGTSACASLSCAYNGGCSSGFNVGDGVIMVWDGTPCDNAPDKICMAEACVLLSSVATGTKAPTKHPTANPTVAPVTNAPTKYPTQFPTTAPVTPSPTKYPTAFPTAAPVTQAPTQFPSAAPVTQAPTKYPTAFPTTAPVTQAPTQFPSAAPVTHAPTKAPTSQPSRAPTTKAPLAAGETYSPSKAPTPNPSSAPTTRAPTAPTSAPSAAPTTRAPTLSVEALAALESQSRDAETGIAVAIVFGVLGGIFVLLLITCCVGGLVVGVFMQRSSKIQDGRDRRKSMASGDDLAIGAITGLDIEHSAPGATIELGHVAPLAQANVHVYSSGGNDDVLPGGGGSKALGKKRSILDVLKSKRVSRKQQQPHLKKTESALTVIGSQRDESGEALPTGWSRHFDDEEDMSYFTSTKGNRPATWTRPQGAKAAAAIKAVTMVPKNMVKQVIVEEVEPTDWDTVKKTARRGTWKETLTLPSKKKKKGKKGKKTAKWNAYRDSDTGYMFWTEAATGRSTWTAPSATEYRVAEDGFAYNKAEFKTHFGGTAEWDTSPPLALNPKRSSGASLMTVGGTGASPFSMGGKIVQGGPTVGI